MKIKAHSRSVALAMLVILLGSIVAEAKKNYACDEPKPADLCTAANTCGSSSAVCTINVRKSGDGSTVKPSVPDAKGNQLFCIKAGTTVVWMSSSKNTGFMISFGSESPFDLDEPIRGGGNKPVTVKAQNPGCYKYDAGAFYSGAVYGMSGGSNPELVILP
jgi:hypothetical protein